MHEEATGAKGIFFAGKNSRSSGCQEEGERGLALTVKHLPLLHEEKHVDPPIPGSIKVISNDTLQGRN